MAFRWGAKGEEWSNSQGYVGPLPKSMGATIALGLQHSIAMAHNKRLDFRRFVQILTEFIQTQAG